MVNRMQLTFFWLQFLVLVGHVTVLFMSPVWASSLEISRPYSVSRDYKPGDRFMGLQLLGTVRLMPKPLKGLKPRELSGLAWDADENLLYAISDDGFVVHLRILFRQDFLARVYLEDAYRLLDRNGATLKESFSDAEGLTARHTRNSILGDTELIISFEREPRLVRYSPQGEYMNEIPLPHALSGARYTGKNKELEALTELNEYGFITGPERPLRNADQTKIPIYATNGAIWLYEPLDAKHSALVGLESMPNGDLLILERRFSSVFQPVIFSLRRMHLNSSRAVTAPPVEELVRFDTSDWKIDNFEGVARHEGSRYFMVSDDNESIVQKTLLMYFKLEDATDVTSQSEHPQTSTTPRRL